MRDVSNEQRIAFEQGGVPDAVAVERIEREARRLQGQALRALIGRLFGRRGARVAAEQGTEAEAGPSLARMRQSAARALSSRANTGTVSEHLLKDVGLTRQDVDGFDYPSMRVYHERDPRHHAT